MESQSDNTDRPMTWQEMLLGLIIAVLLMVITALVFAPLGVDAPKIGPLPWMVE